MKIKIVQKMFSLENQKENWIYKMEISKTSVC